MYKPHRSILLNNKRIITAVIVPDIQMDLPAW